MGQTKSKKFMQHTPISVALSRFLNSISIRIGTETVATSQGLRRVLAESISAPFDIPKEDKSTRDGYAVRSQDTRTALKRPFKFRLIGDVKIGTVPTLKVGKGECAYVATGAVIPKGTDAVVMVENSARIGNRIEFSKAVKAGENVAWKASDIQEGKTILPGGAFLRPEDLGIISALGIKNIKVTRKPRIAVLSTGDELLDRGKQSHDGKTFDVNRPALCALLEEEGGIPLDMGIAPDDPVTIKRKLTEGLKRSDAVIVSAGTSVGEKDFLPKVVNELGKPGLLVHGIAMRPGSPTALASVDGKPLLLLPGFPVSCIFSFYVFGRPMLRKILRRRKEKELRIRATLAKDVSGSGTMNFVLVELDHIKDKVKAKPVYPSGSNILSSLVKADGYLVLSPNSSIKGGQEVGIVLTRPVLGDILYGRN